MSARREKRRDRNGTEKWYWIVDFVFRHPDGRTERIRRYSPVNNKRGAEMYERELRQQMLGCNPDDVQTESEPRIVPTLADFAKEFVTGYAKANNKASEVKSKEVSLGCHLVPALGAKRLDKITVRDVEAYKAAKLNKGYVAKTINNHLGCLRKLLRTAVEWDLIEVVPMIKPLKAQKPQVRFLNFEESQALIDCAEPEWRAMIIVALNTGLRLGELLALRWKYVDLHLGQLVVCENDWRGMISSPKGNKARVILLNNRTLEALKAHRHTRGPLVFCRPDGQRLTYQRCRSPLLRASKRAGFSEHVQWHALRHTFASQLVMRGVPLRAVQELLGHTTIDMTMRYAHLTPDARRSAVAALDDQQAAGHGTLMAQQNGESEKPNKIN